MDNKQKKRRKLSKKSILYLINGVFFAIVFLIFYVKCAFEFHNGFGIFLTCDVWLKILILQCIFAFGSCIVYFFSIIADAISNKYNDKKE